MQLVPSSGGRDAYRYVFHEDKIPSPQFLYDPENNIRLGVGYLELTKDRYFAGVRNPGILYLLTVASYNTGPGNVARALTGKRHLKPAVKVARSMEIEEVYRTLRNKLPYKETQGYIRKVLQRAKMYRGM
jgi:membrane-bound lytic murein transglycosylase C